MKNITLYILAFFVFTMMSCQEDIINTGKSTQFDPPDIITANTSLVVYVKDQWNVIPDAELSINGITVTTSESGRAFIPLTRINKNGDLLTISRNDRITLTKRILLEAGKKNITRVHMERSAKKYNYESSEPIELTTSDFVLNIPANAFKSKIDDIDYTGQIDMEFKYLDGDDEILHQKMPGSLLSRDEEGRMGRLNPFGMVYFEFFGDDGESLQLRENITANIIYKLSPELAQIAEDGSPVFYLNEETGYWEEETKAKLVGNNYHVDVSHFSWWACQLYSCIEDIVTISGTVISEDGTPCGGCLVEIIADGGSHQLYTSSEGTFTTLSCPRETYEVVVYHNHPNCDEEDGVSLGNYVVNTIDVDWGEMIIDDINLVTISGQVLPCDSEEGEEGAYLIINNELVIETFGNGEFSFSACIDDLSPLLLTGYNTGGTMQSIMQEIIVSPDGNNNIILNTCDESDVYLKVWRDGDLKAMIGQVAQDYICHENKKICISVPREFFQMETFGCAIEFTSDIDLNALGEYMNVTATNGSSIIYQEDKTSNGGFLGLTPIFDDVNIVEYDEYKTVYMKFSTVIGGQQGGDLDLNYEVEFRIRI